MVKAENADKGIKMRKIILAVLLVSIMAALAGCKEEKETADSYADKLVNGEIEVDESKEYDDNSDVKEDKKADNKKDKKEIATDKPMNVNLGVTDEEMASYIDKAASDYKSFNFQSIESPDFFLNKKLRIAASVSDHKLNNIYSAAIEATFNNSAMTMEYESEGQKVKNEYYVYTVSDEIKTTPGGIQYTYVAYGDQEITSESTDGTIAVLTRLSLPDTVDMGEASADSYIMMIETSNNGVYELFKEENM